MGNNLNKAFGSFRWQREQLKSPHFVLADAGTHGLATVAPVLDGDIATLAPKRPLLVFGGW